VSFDAMEYTWKVGEKMKIIYICGKLKVEITFEKSNDIEKNQVSLKNWIASISDWKKINKKNKKIKIIFGEQWIKKY
jgi:hypothetical protein